MPVLTTVITHATGDVYPASDWNIYNRDNMNYLIAAGADLASAATITPTNEFHGVTGVTTIDNLTPATPVAGQRVRLWIKGGPLTIRNNGAGTGNIRTRNGGDRLTAANEIVTFVYDGATWREEASAVTKLVRGLVSAAGGVASGSGFSINPLGAGSYIITFAPGFAASPAVVVTPNDNSGARWAAEHANTSNTSVTVQMWAQATGVFTNAAFDFIAMEV